MNFIYVKTTNGSDLRINELNIIYFFRNYKNTFTTIRIVTNNIVEDIDVIETTDEIVNMIS